MVVFWPRRAWDGGRGVAALLLALGGGGGVAAGAAGEGRRGGGVGGQAAAAVGHVLHELLLQPLELPAHRRERGLQWGLVRGG